MRIEATLAAMNLALPAEIKVPPGFQIKWRQVRIIGSRGVVAGHGPRQSDGSFAGKAGKVGSDLTVEEGYAAARHTALAVLGDLKRELGDLDRVVSWTRVFGMVNSAPGFNAQPQVIDGFTDLMIALYGEESAICPRAVVRRSRVGAERTGHHWVRGRDPYVGGLQPRTADLGTAESDPLRSFMSRRAADPCLLPHRHRRGGVSGTGRSRPTTDGRGLPENDVTQ